MPVIVLAALAVAFLLAQRITVMLDTKERLDRDQLWAVSYLIVLTGIATLPFVDLPVVQLMADCGMLCLSVGVIGLSLEIGNHLWIQRKKIALRPANPEYVSPEASVLTEEFTDTTVVITDDIQCEDYASVYRACSEAIKANTPVTIRLVTIGGDVDSANAIIDLIERFIEQGHIVRVIASGKCMSAGTMILTAVPVENRYATKRTSFMVHHVRSSASLGRNERTRRRDEEYITLLTSRSNVSADSLRELFKSEQDYYMDPVEALSLGLIGQII